MQKYSSSAGAGHAEGATSSDTTVLEPGVAAGSRSASHPRALLDKAVSEWSSSSSTLGEDTYGGRLGEKEELDDAALLGLSGHGSSESAAAAPAQVKWSSKLRGCIGAFRMIVQRSADNSRVLLSVLQDSLQLCFEADCDSDRLERGGFNSAMPMAQHLDAIEAAVSGDEFIKCDLKPVQLMAHDIGRESELMNARQMAQLKACDVHGADAVVLCITEETRRGGVFRFYVLLTAARYTGAEVLVDRVTQLQIALAEREAMLYRKDQEMRRMAALHSHAMAEKDSRIATLEQMVEQQIESMKIKNLEIARLIELVSNKDEQISCLERGIHHSHSQPETGLGGIDFEILTENTLVYTIKNSETSKGLASLSATSAGRQ